MSLSEKIKELQKEVKTYSAAFKERIQYWLDRDAYDISTRLVIDDSSQSLIRCDYMVARANLDYEDYSTNTYIPLYYFELGDDYGDFKDTLDQNEKLAKEEKRLKEKQEKIKNIDYQIAELKRQKENLLK